MSDTPIIDLTRYDWKREQGDVVVIGTWSMHNGRPVMVLMPNSRRTLDADKVTPCLVPLDLAYMWDEYTGDAIHCAQMTWQFAAALGLSQNDPRTLLRLTSIIRDHLGDLLTMRPLTDADMVRVADVEQTDTNTGKTREAGVWDFV